MKLPEEPTVSDPEILARMPVIKGSRVLVYDLAASVAAEISRDRILAAYPTTEERHLDLAVAYAKAYPVKPSRKVPSARNAALVKSGYIPRRKR